MKKQDRQGVRTPAALEQKYDLTGSDRAVAEARQSAAEAKRAAAEAQAAVNVLNQHIVELQDYILERGASGKWFYEKWASGKAVCWCTTDPMSVNYETELVSGAYSAVVSYTFPTDLFSTAPSYVCVNSISSDGLTEERISEISTEAMKWRSIVGSSSAVTRSIQFLIEAKGTWKEVSA